MRNFNISDGKKQSGSRNLLAISTVLVLISFLSLGCGGSSGSSTDGAGNSSGTLQGTFIDSPVQGLDYYSATHSGITDEDGHFMYEEGEMMTFSIGDVVLGQAMAREVMTPIDFLDSSEMPHDLTNPVVMNMGRFLQSLDTDGDPENGIMLSQDVREEVSGRMIDFHQSIADFENDPDVTACFDVLNGLDVPHNGMMWGLVSVENARHHMTDHMGAYIENSGMGTGTGTGMETGTGTGMETGTGTGMETGTGTGMGTGMSNNSGKGTGRSSTMGGNM